MGVDDKPIIALINGSHDTMSAYLPLIAMCAGLTAYLAYSKSRNPVAWFFVGLFTGPVGVIVALVIKDR